MNLGRDLNHDNYCPGLFRCFLALLHLTFLFLNVTSGLNIAVNHHFHVVKGFFLPQGKDSAVIHLYSVVLLFQFTSAFCLFNNEPHYWFSNTSILLLFCFSAPCWPPLHTLTHTHTSHAPDLISAHFTGTVNLLNFSWKYTFMASWLFHFKSILVVCRVKIIKRFCPNTRPTCIKRSLK